MKRRRPSSAPAGARHDDRHARRGSSSKPAPSFDPSLVFGRYRPSSGLPRFAVRNTTAGLTSEGYAKALHTVNTKIDLMARSPRTRPLPRTQRRESVRPCSQGAPTTNSSCGGVAPRARPKSAVITRSASAGSPVRSTPRVARRQSKSAPLRRSSSSKLPSHHVNAVLGWVQDVLDCDSVLPTPADRVFDYDKLAYWPPHWYVDQFESAATSYEEVVARAKATKPSRRQVHSAPSTRLLMPLAGTADGPGVDKREAFIRGGVLGLDGGGEVRSPPSLEAYDDLDDLVIEDDNEISPEVSRALGPLTELELRRDPDDRKVEDEWSHGKGDTPKKALSSAEKAEQDSAKFVGAGARQAFFDSLPSAARTYAVLGVGHAEEEGLQDCDEISPRMQYIIELLRSNRLPWPTILRKASSPTKLSLEGLGLGDEVALVIAKYLGKFPELQSLNLGANRLKTQSVRGIVKAITGLGSLLELDLRQNDVGSAACTMCDWLQSRDCRLRRLCLSKAKLSDREAVPLMTALISNRTVTYLDLSHNALCKEESLNFLHPEFTTGGEAVADLMTHNNTLRELDLSWNFIRDASATSIGEALGLNTGLTRLDVSYNTFGHNPAQALGVALLKNSTLLHLNMAYNSITPKGSWVLCTAFSTNMTLTELNMDGNRLGKLGSEAILSVVRRSGSSNRHLMVTMRGCDCESVDPTLFDPMEPTGNYTLELSDPYSRMVLNELLRLASLRAGCRFTFLGYRPPPTSERRSSKFNPIELTYARRRVSVIESWKSPANTMGRTKRLGMEVLKKAVHGQGGQPIASKLPQWMLDGRTILEQLAAAGSAHRKEKAQMKLFGSRTSDPETVGDFSLQHEEANKLKFNLERLLTTMGFNPTSLLLDQIALVLPRAQVETEKDLVLAVFMAAVRVVESEQPDLTFGQLMRVLREHLGLELGEDSILLDTGLYMYFERDHRDSYISTQQAVDWLFESFATNKDVAEKPSLEVLVHKETGEPWQPPSEGTVKVDFLQLKLPPSSKEFQDTGGLQALINNIKKGTTEQDRVKIFETSMRNSDVYLNALQAQLLIDVMSKEHPKAWAIENLLPVMTNPHQATKTLFRNLSHVEIVQLRIKMGDVFKICVGNPTGHYCFDLGKEDERRSLNKLGRINNFEKNVMRLSENPGLNTSQKGSGDNFRTEAMNGKATAITEAVFSKEIPQAGKIRFDYVTTSRPHSGVVAITDRQFQYLVELLSLGRLYKVTRKRAETTRHKKQAARAPPAPSNPSNTSLHRGHSPPPALSSTTTRGRMPPTAASTTGKRKQGESPPPTTTAIPGKGTIDSLDEAMTTPRRGSTLGHDHLSSTPPSPDLTHGYLSSTAPPPLADTTNYQGKPSTTAPPSKRPSLMVVLTAGERRASLEHKAKQAASLVVIKEEASGHVTNTFNPVAQHGLPSWVPEKTVFDWWTDYKDSDSFSMEAAKYWGSETTRVSPADQALRDKSFQRPSICKETQVNVTGKCVFLKLVTLECIIFNTWITSKQAREILKEFPSDYWGKVQAASILFSRIVDLENMDLVLDSLTQLEYLELCHRLGYLNVVNPLKPDRYYSLDLRCWEHRELCKVFIKLAIEEPGENWVDETYQWSFYDEPLAGWGLPLSWATSDEEGGGRGGPKRSGRLTLIYTSTGPGCAPRWEVRRDLKTRFLCSNVPTVEVDWRGNSSAKLWDMVSAHDKVASKKTHALHAARAIQVMQTLTKGGAKELLPTVGEVRTFG